MQVVLGTIIKTYQLHGDVKIKSNTDFAKKRFKKDTKVNVYNPYTKDNQILTIASYKNISGVDIIRFNEYDNPEDAKKLVGYQIIIDRPDNNPGKDNYYYVDLYECNIIYQDKIIGKVVDIINTGSSVILRIKRDNQNDLLYPFVDKFIESINIDNKTITINPIDGMI